MVAHAKLVALETGKSFEALSLRKSNDIVSEAIN